MAIRLQTNPTYNDSGHIITEPAFNRNSGIIDAFGRIRISDPHTTFDGKQLYDKAPLFFDESITNGSGNATSTHSIADASTTMYVESGDTIIRQTKTHWNYQPGKSQLVFMTGRIEESGGATGVKARIGIFTATDGLFFELDATTMYIVERKASSDTSVVQSSWNIDVMDGTGASGITLDWSQEQIFFLDYEWLGVGTVRYGVVVNGTLYYIHESHHANQSTSVYMSTPNLPVRYEISSTSGNGNMEHTCCSVISEGGIEENFVIKTASTDATHCNANTVGTAYAVIGIRLKSTHLDASVMALSASMVSETNDAFEYFVLINPTIASGTFTWTDETNSAVQVGRCSGNPGPTITGGDVRVSPSGQASVSTRSGESSQPSSLLMGSAINGTPDEFILCVRPYGANADIQGTLTWRELL